MSGRDRMEYDEFAPANEPREDPVRSTRTQPSRKPRLSGAFSRLMIGELLAIAEEGHTPLVRHAAQEGTAALAAQTLVDLHEAHIGFRVALLFEDADPRRPVIIGVLHEGGVAPSRTAVGNVEVDVDGERLIVSAREQLVLRCGNASITLTRAGKVLIRGTYVSSRSSGANRITGGSVQLN
ncbi:DUF6484 domain-containing protein [Paraburkholderia sp. MMS20-SJTR3]|uniref:DUF6484 domain-containing protein n=1 Tax=Paraburkholderia sejongensis TaxID=2886946 RepID=A0ABS8JRI4_9BURK|nr:DUF6484 domain-containing protein [Paraburkholderia sp. MMS20-SJTR3]MCC8392513.1 DUF6484 domain-containing protein [Paraburkholderia sp. MMS20-SJTR3]